MTQGSRSSSVEPLSVRNIVSSGLQLHREKFKEYFPIALVAVGWSLLPVLGMIGLGLILAFIIGATQQLTAAFWISVYGGVALIVLAVSCAGKSLVNSALITRLAFGELKNEPEATTDARRFVDSRKWSFLVAQIWVWLMIFGPTLGFYLVARQITSSADVGFIEGLLLLLIQLILLSFVLMVFDGNFTGVSLLLIVVVTIAGSFWLSARLFAAEVPLAVEPEMLTLPFVQRFWSLTKGNVWRVFAVLLITFLITLPIFIIAQSFSTIPQGLVLGLLRNNPDTLAIGDALSTLTRFATSLLFSVLVLPLWQIIKTVVYYDLRTRQKGLGLKLRDH